MKQFGAKINESHKNLYAQSANWKEGKFENLETTTMDVNLKNMPKLLYQQMSNRKGRNPLQPIPLIGFDAEAWEKNDNAWIWYGHSALLLKLSGKTILIDPMLGDNASPIAPFRTARFSTGSLEMIDQFPTIDAVFISHDHYDHLDMASILKLKTKTRHFYTALGVGRHLEAWGISPDKITELDWWQDTQVGNIQVHFTPSRHFSGRGLRDRAKSLWGGWVFQTNEQKIYFSGDGGYGKHFTEVGKRFGPFDLGFVECGQYHSLWHQIHMYPEEAVQAAIDSSMQSVVPVHWAGFSLSLHHWKDPIERFVNEGTRQNIQMITPAIGAYMPSFGQDNSSSSYWWEKWD